MIRRDFCRMSATAMAAVALPWHDRSCTPAGLDRIGIQLYTLRSALSRDFEGTLRQVAEIGYREVEFAGFYDRKPRDLRALLDGLGMVAPSGHVSYDAVKQRDTWQPVLDAAAELGNRYVVIAWMPAGERQSADDWKRMGGYFNRAGEEARRMGLTFAYHNHEFEFAPLPGGGIPMDILLESTDPALVQVELDLYWITLGGRDPLRYFERWPGRFPMVHVKDMEKDGDKPRMVDVGRGDIDFAAILARREAAGIRHYFVEHDQPENPLETARNSFQYLRGLKL